MSIVCPHRCVPFSKWRLDLLRSLCALPEHPQPLIFPLRPRIRASQSQPGTRTYSSGKPSGGAGPSVRNEDSTSEIKEKEDRHAGRYSTIFEDLPTNQPEQRPISSGILEAPSTNETVTETRRRKPQKAWSPYTEDSRQEIKHLLETLENIANQDEDVRRLERNLEARSHRFLPRPKPTDLPQSPILKKVSKREKPAKEIRNPALEPLAHDPWARMLAEPIRQCRASQVRMPVSLLSNWGLTRHPKTDEVYLVPSELADIDNDERVTTREESKWRKRMRELELEANCAPIEGINPYAELRDEVAFEDDASAKQNAAKSRDSGSRPSSSSFHSHSSSGNVRVLLYDNLINLFSLQSLRKIASKTSVARYLVPRQMVDEFERAQHYHKNRKHFESLTGVPNTIPTTTAAAFDLSKVKWKNDIGPRILDILRRRLKIAFVKSASAERSQRQKRMYAVSMIKMMNPSQWHPNTVDRGRARTSAKNDATVHVMSTSATGTPNLKYDDRDAPQTTSERALPPRIYLHLGPPQSPLLRKFSNGRRTPMLPPLVSREPGKPESRAQRFPVFPVSAMLGESHYREFLGLVVEHGYLEHELADKMTRGEEHLLMVRPSVDNENLEVLVRAVWRLWRWGGGRRWMVSEEERREEDWREAVSGLEEGIGREGAMNRHVRNRKPAKQPTEQSEGRVMAEGEEGGLEDERYEEHDSELVEHDQNGELEDEPSQIDAHDEQVKL